MTLPQPLHPAACPTCQRPYPLEAPQFRPLTDREIDMLSAWYHYRSVQLAAVLLGVKEQRGKNLLASVRAKTGMPTNIEAATLHLASLRSLRTLATQHNRRQEER